MTIYLTVRDIAEMFKKSERTIWRWIDEGKKIEFDEKLYLPDKDPGGCWRFKVIIKSETRPVNLISEIKSSRRVYSSGIK